MQRVFLATLMSVAFGVATAVADTTAYHVGATADGGPGSDPNPIGSNTKFFIADNPNKAETGPLSIFFAVPEGEAAPLITTIFHGLTSVSFTGPLELVSLGDYTAALKTDFYSFVGCTACNASLNFPNFTDGIEADTTLPAAPTAYDAYQAIVNVNFAGKDNILVSGRFAEGTYIAPLSGAGVDTSFTNAGLITGSVVINPTSGVPEASTWAMLVAGFGLMALGVWYRGRSVTGTLPTSSLSA